MKSELTTEASMDRLLAPDGYTRYAMATRVIKEIFNQEPVKVLDIGGKNTLLWKVLKEEGVKAEYTILDQLEGESTEDFKFVRGTGAKVPFEDNSFDVVLSTDVLEHVGDKNKTAFLKESMRVAKSICILAAPFESPEVDYAERAANDFYRSIFGHDHKWLAEHFECNKPDHQQIGEWLKKGKIPFISFGSNNLENWTLSVSLNFLGEKYDQLALATQKLNAYYNKNFTKLGDTEEPAYRSFYVLFKDAESQHKLNVPKVVGKADYQKKIQWQLKIAEMVDRVYQAVTEKSDEFNSLKQQKADLTTRVCEQESQITVLSAQLQAIINSRSWKVAQFLAKVASWPKRALGLKK